MSARVWLGLLGGALLLASSAAAHTRSTSYSTWAIDGVAATVRFDIPQYELTRLPWGIVAPPRLPPELATYLVGALRLEAGGEACAVVEPPRALAAPADRAVIEWSVRCARSDELAIVSEVLQEVAPSHLHFAKLRGERVVERLLTSASPRWELPRAEGEAKPALGSSLLEYVKLGVEHILTGYDHLVFLLGLLLLAARASEVVTVVTGFTVAHSITLGLAALGRVHPDGAAVEALIGLSIAIVATDNAWLTSARPRALPRAITLGFAALALAAALGAGAISATTYAGLALFAACYFALLARSERPARLRFAVAFCFGLVHGFGFAGVLAEFALPQDRLLAALLGFNAGVELGQLVCVALFFTLAWLAARFVRDAARALARDVANAAVCCAGVYWWVSRAFA
ncbi:MAG: HupE/UreJ family protein [Deltaproteobacteria bacterium]|nr:HupE/UreJ family protein [Deltaproteobacteria bacterium]